MTKTFDQLNGNLVSRVWESNGYNDSDWYAIVWDAAKGDFTTICTGTTRGGCSPENPFIYSDQGIEKLVCEPGTPAFGKAVEHIATRLCRQHNDRETALVAGKTVVITGGRKVAKGTECVLGKVFHNGFTPCYGQCPGLDVHGQAHVYAIGGGQLAKYISVEYMKVAHPDMKTPADFADEATQKLVREGWVAFTCGR